MSDVVRLRETVGRLTRENASLRAELAAAKERCAWRPIETVPKNGTAILAFRKYGSRPIILRWDAVYEEWEDEGRDHVYSVTHWMPLPPPPASDPSP